MNEREIEAAAERQAKCSANGKNGDLSCISCVYDWPWISGDKNKPWLPGKPDYERDRQRLVEFAITRIAADRAAIEQAYLDDRSAEQIAEHIVAAIEFAEPPTGNQWALREGFSLGLSEQYKLARLVLSRAAADRAEREERERRVDWSWCEANCHEVVTYDGRGATWRLESDEMTDVRLFVWDDMSGGIWWRDGFHGDDWNPVPATWTFKTMCQLLDLLRALCVERKGGE